MNLRFLAVPTLLLTSLLSAAEPVDIDVEKAAKLLASEETVVVVDVRTPEEFAEGHLPGAVNIDFNGDDFEARIAKLDPAKPCLVYCAVGGRSGLSLETFQKLKFAKVHHLADGYKGWTAAGKPAAR